MNTTLTRYLRLDSPFLRGTDVQSLQSRLGVPAGQCDGVFGSATQRGVIAFQKNNRLAADGIVGPKTWSVLFGQSIDEQAATKNPKNFNAVLSGYIAGGLDQFHNRYPDSVKWRLTANGLEIETSGIDTSKGKPETVRRICDDYKDELQKASLLTGVPVELLIATMCTEAFDSKMHTVNPRAERKEPGYISDAATPHRVSYGLMQTLISTARHAISELAVEPVINEDKIDRDWLFVPANAILAGAAYIASQSQQTQFDPPLVACAYNAGSVIYNSGSLNRWKMRQYPLGSDAHANRFVQWFNDCFRFFKEHGYPFASVASFWQQLNPDSQAASTSSLLRETVAEYIFPLRKRPSLDYKSGAREFGASRAGGKRKHAGCDLKAPKDTEILCMANGKVIRGPYYFYEGTYALEVQHENGLVVRYGEISAKVPQGISSGAKVAQGQNIAFVGQLNSGNSMLHLEMYAGTKTGPLTQTGTLYKRRADLLDPTKYLDNAILIEAAGEAMAVLPQAVPEDRSKTAEPRELNNWEQLLVNVPTTGASKQTAQQDHLAPGLEASRKMAEADLPRIKQLADRFHSAAAKFGLPCAVLAALASRESRCGAMLNNEGWGDHNQAFGIMQIDKRHHELQGLPDPQSVAHIEQAAGILCVNLERIAEIHQDWEPPFILKGAVVAYNSGIDNVRTKDKMDKGTTGDDYGSDVIARAQYYLQHKELPVFRQ
jgi:murein DD-endopeptidase MepM/ murein hydrolase activator NlpD